MRLLDRYLLRELLVPFGYCLCGFLIFWISFDLFSELNELQEHKLHGADIVEYYLIKSPEFLIIVLPIALLLALLYALTNHARHHELTAIRAAGVSLWRLSLPYLAVGFICSLALFALNEFCAPNSVAAAEQILNRRQAGKAKAASKWQTNVGFDNSRDGRRWLIGAFNIETHEMRNVHVDWRLPDGSLRVFVADRAARNNGVWTFFKVDKDVQEETYASDSVLPVSRNQTNMLALPEFSETPEQINNAIKIDNQTRSSRVKKTEIPLTDLLDYLRLNPHPPRDKKRWVYTQLHSRLAAPWTCLVVVLISIPFGAASGRRNVFVGVASSILICFVYFILLNVGLALGAGGYLPGWFAAWFPNLAFAITGLWLTSRVR